MIAPCNVSEIVSSYLHAKNPERQIKIEAELNDCSEKDIVNILIDAGVCLSEQPEKECQRRRREVNKEARAEYQRKYQRRYRKVNKEKYNEYQRQYQRQYQRRYRQADKEKYCEYQRHWRKANKEKCCEYQRKYREAKKKIIAEYQHKETALTVGAAQDGSA